MGDHLKRQHFNVLHTFDVNLKTCGYFEAPLQLSIIYENFGAKTYPQAPWLVHDVRSKNLLVLDRNTLNFGY